MGWYSGVGTPWRTCKMINENILTELLIKHEGFRLKPYKDSVGKLTIGVGRNLDDNGIRRIEAMFMLRNDIQDVYEQIERYSWFHKCNEVRRLVLMDMVFNLGLPKFLGFKRMISALLSSNWEEASREMLDSKWATQVGQRAIDLAEMMFHGDMR